MSVIYCVATKLISTEMSQGSNTEGIDGCDQMTILKHIILDLLCTYSVSFILVVLSIIIRVSEGHPVLPVDQLLHGDHGTAYVNTSWLHRQLSIV